MPEGDLSLLQGERRVLEMLATNASLGETLAGLIAFVESEEQGLRCGVLVAATDGAYFRESYGPSIPAAYHDALVRQPFTPPYVGACAEVAHRGEAILLPDIAAAGYSDRWRELVSACGLASLASTPIAASDGALGGAVGGLLSLLRMPVTEQELTERVAILLEGDAGSDVSLLAGVWGVFQLALSDIPTDPGIGSLAG